MYRWIVFVHIASVLALLVLRDPLGNGGNGLGDDAAG